MKGPSFVTALLRHKANHFIPLRFLAALQLMVDLQVPTFLTATFLYAFPVNRCFLIRFCGCSYLESKWFVGLFLFSKALSLCWPLV